MRGLPIFKSRIWFQTKLHSCSVHIPLFTTSSIHNLSWRSLSFEDGSLKHTLSKTSQNSPLVSIHSISSLLSIKPTPLWRAVALLAKIWDSGSFYMKKTGSFSIDDSNGSENVSFKMNSRFFNLCGIYSNLLKMASVGEFPWSWFLEDRTQV